MLMNKNQNANKLSWTTKPPGAGTLQIGYGSTSPPLIGDPVGPSNTSLPGVAVAVVANGNDVGDGIGVVGVVGVVGGGVGCS